MTFSDQFFRAYGRASWQMSSDALNDPIQYDGVISGSVHLIGKLVMVECVWDNALYVGHDLCL